MSWIYRDTNLYANTSAPTTIAANTFASHSNATDYVTGETVAYDGAVYEANKDITATNFNFADWDLVVEGDEVGNEIQDWVASTAYEANDIIIEGNTLYKVLANMTTPAVFDEVGLVPLGNVFEKLSQFISDTDIAAADLGKPTKAEVQAHVTANGLLDKTLFYTGTAVDTDEITYVFDVDSVGVVTMIEKPDEVLIKRHLTLAELSAFGTDLTNPTVLEVQALSNSLADVKNTLWFYTGTDSDIDNVTYVYHVDKSGIVMEIQSPSNIALAHAFVADTTLVPATTGMPTIAEISTFASANNYVDRVLYYTGTDNGLDEATYIYHVDIMGHVALLEKPVIAKERVLADATTVAAVDFDSPTLAEIEAFVLAGALTDTIVIYTGTDSDADEVTFAYHVDVLGVTTVIEKPETIHQERAFADATTVGAVLINSPTLAEVEAFILAEGLVDRVVFYTGTDSSADKSTHVYHVDIAGAVTLLQEPVIANERVFADSTTVAAADILAPTQAEIEAFVLAGTVTDTVLFYTGTDVDTDGVLYAYHVDILGAVTLLEKPVLSNDRVFISDTDMSPALVGEPTVAEAKVYTDANALTDTILFYTGTDLDTDELTYAYHVDFSGEVTQLDKPNAVPNDRIFIDDFTMSPALSERPTAAEAEAAIAADGSVDTVFFYTGTADDTDDIVSVYHVDASGNVTTMMYPKEKNSRVFLTQGGNPEVPVFATIESSILASDYRNTIFYYTGTTNQNDEATYVWYVDDYDKITLIESPVIANDHVFADDTTLAPAAALEPTIVEVEAYALANTITDSVVYYTGTDVDTDEVKYIYHIDNAGSALLIKEPFVPKDRIHLASLALASTDQLNPTIIEVQSYVATNGLTDEMLYYTGTDINTDEPTYVYHVDGSGMVTLLEKPETEAPDRIFIGDTTLAPAIAGEPTSAELEAFIAADTTIDTLFFYTGTDVETDEVLYAYSVDGSGNITRIEQPAYQPQDIHHISTSNITLADTNEPTLTEIQTYVTAEGLTNTVAYYAKRTSDAKILNKYTYWIDNSGDAIEIRKPTYIPNSKAMITAAELDATGETYNADAPEASVVYKAIATEVFPGMFIMNEAYEDRFIYYRGASTTPLGTSNSGTDNIDAIYRVDKSGYVFLIWNKNLEAAKNRTFVTATALGAVDIANPTEAEMDTYASTNDLVDTVIRYNGTDIDNIEPTYVFHADVSKNVTVIEKPSVAKTLVNLITASDATPLEVGTINHIDTDAAQVDLVLPTTDVEEGDFIEFVDRKRTFATNNVSLTVEDGSDIDGEVAPYLLDVDTAEVRATYLNGAWEIAALGYSASGGGSSADIVDDTANGSMVIGNMLMQWGSVSVSNNYTLTFDQPFGSAPTVVAVSNSWIAMTTVASITTTGCSLGCKDPRSGASGSGTVQWQAIGQKA